MLFRSVLKISAPARDYIANKGFDAQYGARPLKRAIQKYLEDPMAEVLIRAPGSEGDTISVGFNQKKDLITIRVKKGTPPPQEADNQSS